MNCHICSQSLESARCACQEADQTPEHVLLDCPLWRTQRPCLARRSNIRQIAKQLWGSADELKRTVKFIEDVGLNVWYVNCQKSNAKKKKNWSGNTVIQRVPSCTGMCSAVDAEDYIFKPSQYLDFSPDSKSITRYTILLLLIQFCPLMMAWEDLPLQIQTCCVSPPVTIGWEGDADQYLHVLQTLGWRHWHQCQHCGCQRYGPSPRSRTLEEG
jgi:hypothetical protein